MPATCSQLVGRSPGRPPALPSRTNSRSLSKWCDKVPHVGMSYLACSLCACMSGEIGQQQEQPTAVGDPGGQSRRYLTNSAVLSLIDVRTYRRSIAIYEYGTVFRNPLIHTAVIAKPRCQNAQALPKSCLGKVWRFPPHPMSPSTLWVRAAGHMLWMGRARTSFLTFPYPTTCHSHEAQSLSCSHTRPCSLPPEHSFLQIRLGSACQLDDSLSRCASPFASCTPARNHYLQSFADRISVFPLLSSVCACVACVPKSRAPCVPVRRVGLMAALHTGTLECTMDAPC